MTWELAVGLPSSTVMLSCSDQEERSNMAIRSLRGSGRAASDWYEAIE